MNRLSDIKIGIKLWILNGIALAGMITIAGLSLYDLNKIEGEISAIAEKDMPLTKMVTSLTLHQLDLGVTVEKALRHGLEKADNHNAEEKFKETELEFDKTRKKIDVEFKKSMMMLKNEAETSTTDEERTHFSELIHNLEKINDEVNKYVKHTVQVFHLFETGETEKAITQGESAEHEQDNAIKHMELFLSKIEEMTSKRTTNAEHDAQNALVQIMIVVGITIAIVVFMCFVVGRQITNPLNLMLAAALDLKDGEGDLTQRLPNFGKDEIGQTADAFNGFVERMQDTIKEITTSVVNISSASVQVNSTAQSLSQGATEQAANIEEVSTSLEQMSASIDQNSDNSKTTDDIASNASIEAEKGGKAVNETVEAMKQISNKIVLIEDIAYKTNLLALNAAIEAARAGEHGKGFAVVADEVRKLAERSQLSAQEIGDLSKNSVDTAERAGNVLTELVPNIQKTANLVQEISAATNEQSSGVNQINIAIRQLDSVSQTNAAASEELAATSEELNSQTHELEQLVGYFKL